MYLLYLDESGDDSPQGTKHLILAGVSLFEGCWTKAKADIESIMRDVLPRRSPIPELHTSDIRVGRKEFRSVPQSVRFSILDQACQLVKSFSRAQISLFSVVIDKRWWISSRPGQPMYEYAFEEIVSRFEHYLNRLYSMDRPNSGLIVLDQNKPRLRKAIKRNLISFQQAGTRWANVRNIIEGAMFFPSHESPGVQLADLTSYSIWRLVEHLDDYLVSRIFDSFDREPANSTHNPGKWHGIKYLGNDSAVIAKLDRFWQPRP